MKEFIGIFFILLGVATSIFLREIVAIKCSFVPA